MSGTMLIYHDRHDFQLDCKDTHHLLALSSTLRHTKRQKNLYVSGLSKEQEQTVQWWQMAQSHSDPENAIDAVDASEVRLTTWGW